MKRAKELWRDLGEVTKRRLPDYVYEKEFCPILDKTPSEDNLWLLLRRLATYKAEIYCDGHITVTFPPFERKRRTRLILKIYHIYSIRDGNKVTDFYHRWKSSEDIDIDEILDKL